MWAQGTQRGTRTVIQEVPEVDLTLVCSVNTDHNMAPGTCSGQGQDQVSSLSPPVTTMITP